MAKNKISDLRDHLFAALEALADPDNPMAVERALAIKDVAQVIINSAKVEVDLVKAVGGDVLSVMPGSTFFDVPEERPLLTASPTRSPLSRDDAFAKARIA